MEIFYYKKKRDHPDKKNIMKTLLLIGGALIDSTQGQLVEGLFCGVGAVSIV